jgi:DNA-binding NarL/FixJ family response regulator
MRVLIIAAVRLYREGLAEILASTDCIEVVGTAADGEAGARSLVLLRPDIALVDIATPGGVKIVEALREVAPHTKVLALGVVETGQEVLACAEAGVAGYVPREGSLDDLVIALQGAARGEVVCPPEIAASLMRRLAELAGGGRDVVPAAERLTVRELEVARLIERGLTNKEIGRRLGVEVSTVKNHIHSIFEKLHVGRRADAAAWVRRQERKALPDR